MLVRGYTHLSLENDEIIIKEVGNVNELKITFHRTVRVPDNGKKSHLPPSFGRFPLLKVKDYAKTLPVQMTRKGGAFFPIQCK